MNKRCLQNFCAAMMIVSILIRAAVATGLDVRSGKALADTAASAELAQWALYLETGRRTDWPEEAVPAVRVWPVVVEGAAPEAAAEMPDEPSDAAVERPKPAPAAEEEAPTAAPKTAFGFTDAEADAIKIAGACSYTVDKRALLRQPSTLDFSQDGPKVLIVHTHSCEAYTPTAAWNYEASDTLRTRDKERSVIRVGSEIAAVLEEAGIETIHDTALNDDPAYSGAYARMLTTIEGYLEQYPSIQMVLDVHRDAAEDVRGMQLAYTADIAGEPCAQVMLVVGTDEGGLEHPDWRENLANALKLQALLNRDDPGLCRPVDLRTERFNAHTSPGALLAVFCCGRCAAHPGPGGSGKQLSQVDKRLLHGGRVQVGIVQYDAGARIGGRRVKVKRA